MYSRFERNKNGINMVEFVTLFATNFIEVHHCKKGVNFCWIFVGGTFCWSIFVVSCSSLSEVRQS